jgi:zinc protease
MCDSAFMLAIRICRNEMLILLVLGVLGACSAVQPQGGKQLTGEVLSRGAVAALQEEAMLKLEKFGSIQRTRLPNGLTLVLLQRKTVPVVAIQVWMDVGSADEKPGEEGIAHLQEHMIFKGTSTRAVGEIAKAIKGAGGEINAWTSFDHTVVHVVLGSQFLDLGLEVLADALQNALLDEGELTREKKVVSEEIKRASDLPGRKVSNLLFSLAYKAHPYRRPVLGDATAIQKIEKSGLVSFCGAHCIPERMTLVVVGDFDPNSVLKKAKDLFGPMRSKDPSPTNRIQEPGQRKIRIQLEQDDIQEAHFLLGWHIPSARDPKVPALDILATLLGQGESSRFNLELKHGQSLVNNIYAYAYAPKDPGLFVVGATCQADKLVASMRAVASEVGRVSNVPAGAGELSKVKTMIESDALYAQETVQGAARRIGYYQAMLDDPAYGDTYLRQVLAATPEDVRKAAQETLFLGNLSVVALLPKGSSVTAEAIQQAIQEGFVAAQGGESENPKTSGNVTRVKIKNGPVLLVEEDHTNGLVALRGVFLGGVRGESDQNNGIHHFLAGMLTRGTLVRSASEIARTIDSIAGSMGGFSGRNSFGLRAEFPARDFDRGLQLFSDCLLAPAFLEKEIKRQRELTLEAIASREDNLSGLAFDLFVSTLYGSHPYRFPILGKRSTVAAFRRNVLTEFMGQHFTPDKMVLSVVGDVDANRVVEQVKAMFSFKAEQKKPTLPPVLPLEPAPNEIRKAFLAKPKAQSHLVLGFLGTTMSSEDRYPLEVLSAILTGQGGRLFVELRDRQSLAYSITGFSLEGIEPGYFALYMAVDPKRSNEAVFSAKAQLKRLEDEPPSEEELNRAKQYLVGIHSISLQKVSARAAVMAFDELYGLGYMHHRTYSDRIMAVTAEDVGRVVKKYLSLDSYVLAVVGPENVGTP